MKTNKLKLAFSLIELSIVILIIGILVIGISKGSRIIKAARLTSARTLTTSSPVNLNADKVGLWLDATSSKSFDVGEIKDGGTISNWYDARSNVTDPINLSASGTAKPTYYSASANGLPTISFDGVNNSMSNSNVNSNSLTQGGNQITMFIVEKYLTPNHDSTVFDWENYGPWERIILLPLYGGSLRFDFGPCCPGGTTYGFTPLETFKNRTHILTVVHRPNNTGFVRVNGTTFNPTSGLTSVISSGALGNLTLGSGGGQSLHGEINEVIVFKTALTDSEIANVEKYLSQKWGVALKGL